jgi:hypothetical protein
VGGLPFVFPVALRSPVLLVPSTSSTAQKSDALFRPPLVEAGLSRGVERLKLFAMSRGRRRQLRKVRLAELLGGQCMKCGYRRTPSALEFHHRNERKKSFNVCGNNLTKYSWERLVAEVKKCDLLCANCHRELHDEYGWIHEDGKRTSRAKAALGSKG